MGHESIKSLRADLAALCCAGAYVTTHPEVWEAFLEWVGETDPKAEQYDFHDPQHVKQMMLSVLRVDRVVMMAQLLTGTDDQEIKAFLEGEDK